MPCIVMYTNMEVPKEKAEELKKALVVSWEKLPGKSERWLITTIRDNTTMFFGGKDTPAAFVNFIQGRNVSMRRTSTVNT